MQPKRGGPPLPPPPLCLPGEHAKALAYVAALEQALTHHGRSQSQRAYIRTRLRHWLLRSEGRDAYFEKFGTFTRWFGSPPPTPQDMVVAHWRRLALARGATRDELKARKFPKRFRPRVDLRGRPIDDEDEET